MTGEGGFRTQKTCRATEQQSRVTDSEPVFAQIWALNLDIGDLTRDEEEGWFLCGAALDAGRSWFCAASHRARWAARSEGVVCAGCMYRARANQLSIHAHIEDRR